MFQPQFAGADFFALIDTGAFDCNLGVANATSTKFNFPVAVDRGVILISSKLADGDCTISCEQHTYEIWLLHFGY